MANYFSKNLKYLRELQKLSQNKLAEKIGVNQTTIARWEDDNRTPTVDNAIDVSIALNIPLPELLGVDLTIEENYKKVIQKDSPQQIYCDKNGYSIEYYNLNGTRFHELPNETKVNILKQALEEKQRLILEETEQLFNIKKELSNIEKKSE